MPNRGTVVKKCYYGRLASERGKRRHHGFAFGGSHSRCPVEAGMSGGVSHPTHCTGVINRILAKM